MARYGPWRDDSVPFWVTTASAATRQTATVRGWGHYAQAAASDFGPVSAAVWADTPESNDNLAPRFEVDYFEGGNTTATWQQVWVTATRAGDHTVTSGILPADVTSDPNVIGVEWEPTATPEAQRAHVFIDSTGGITPVTTDGFDVSVKLVEGTTEPYDPAPLSGAGLAALATAAVLTLPTTETYLPITGIPATGSASVAATLVDRWTQTQTPPPIATYPSGHLQEYPFRLQLQAEYKPRFRVLYRSGRVPAVRQWPRDDHRGASSAARLWPVSSQQGSPRQLGYL